MRANKMPSVIFIVLSIILISISMIPIHGGESKMDRTVTYIDNGVVKVGVRLDWGGAISEIWYNGINLVDDHDTGRLIQISLYDGDDYYNYSDCGDPNWGWNPVQGGDKYNHGSPVIKYYNRGYEIYIKTRPYEWNPDNKGGGPDTPVYSDIILEQWVRFGVADNVIKVKYRITSLSGEFHPCIGQEFPCIYTNSILNKLAVYDGQNPWQNDTLSYYSLPVHPEPAIAVKSTEYWAALCNESGLSLAIYSKNLYSDFIALGFPPSANTCYLRGNRDFSIHSNGVLEDEMYIIVGDINDVRSKIYDIHANRTVKDTWDFDNTDNFNEMWYAQQQISDFKIAGGYLTMNSTGNDPYILLMHSLGINASEYTTLEIKMYVDSGSIGAIYFTTADDPYFGEDKKITFPLQPGSFATYILNLSEIQTWHGIIDKIRFDPTDTQSHIEIDYIKFRINRTPQPIPLYRLFSSSLGDHLYTTDPTEKYWAEQFGYTYEGICCYLLDKEVEGAVPLYYLYIVESDDSFYTCDDYERKNAMSNGAAYIGIIGYCYPSSENNLVPVYRLYNPDSGDHFYTADWNEAQQANQSYGYVYEGIAFYAYSDANIPELPISDLTFIIFAVVMCGVLRWNR